MKKFVTLFNSENVHLIKDVGLIPYGMNYCGYYDSYIATYDNGDYTYLEDRVKGLKIWKIEKVTGRFEIDAFLFLKRNANEIDVLNLYHTTFRSAVLSYAYKKYNPIGVLYVKLDGGFTKEETSWYKRFRGYVMRKADLVTTELKENCSRLSKSWNRDILLLRNPFHPVDLKEYNPYTKRKNEFITVGRIGTVPKNTVILLEAFEKASLQIEGWKLKLVGPIEREFESYLSSFFDKYPDMKSRIELVGNVVNRDELMRLYSNAKIFVFPSRWESYGIALMEAGMCGTFAICSEITASKELTNDFRYAEHFKAEDKEMLCKLIIKCSQQNEIENLAKKEREYILHECNIENVSKQLNTYINVVKKDVI